MKPEGGWGLGAAALGFVTLFAFPPGLALFLNLASGIIVYGLISESSETSDENTKVALYLGFAMNVISGIYNAFLL